MRDVSDELCRQWGLSVIEPKGRGRHIGEIKDEENGKPTIRGQIKADIDQAIKDNYSWQSFCKTLGDLGYMTEWRGSFFRIRPDQGKKFFRFDRLGDGYSVEDIRRRLNENFYRLHRREEEPFVLPKRDKAKGLYALFLHYQYLLGHLPKTRPPEDWEAYAQMKADRKKLQNYSVLREQNKTKGSERLSNMLRSGKKLRVYTFQEKDLPKFKEVAKQYGILYTVLKEKDHTGGVFDILVRAEDEHKLARVIERFEFSHVDTASLRAEIIKEKEERAAAQKKESTETKEDPKEQATEEKEKVPEETPVQSAEDKAADELMAGAKKRLIWIVLPL